MYAPRLVHFEYTTQLYGVFQDSTFTTSEAVPILGISINPLGSIFKHMYNEGLLGIRQVEEHTKRHKPRRHWYILPSTIARIHKTNDRAKTIK